MLVTIVESYTVRVRFQHEEGDWEESPAREHRSSKGCAVL